MKKRLNNKGYMLVEIILASVLAMVVAYFVIDLTIKLKNKNDDLLVKTLVYTDQAIIYNTIMRDLYNSSESVDCSYIESMIDIDTENNVFKYGDFTNVVSEYASIGNYTCNVDNDSSINLTIPISVEQLPDDEFNIVISDKVSDADLGGAESNNNSSNSSSSGSSNSSSNVDSSSDNNNSCSDMSNITCCRQSCSGSAPKGIVSNGLCYCCSVGVTDPHNILKDDQHCFLR